MKRPLAALFVVVVAIAMIRPLVASTAASTEVAGIRAEALSSGLKQGHQKKPDHPGRGVGLTTTTTLAQSTTTTTGAITTTTAAPSPSTTASATTTTTKAPTSTTAGQTTTTAPVSGVPAGAITVSPGQDLQQVVSGSPAGSTFYLLAGTHSGHQIEPRNGDTFLGASGAVMTGNGSAAYAFESSASNVTIRGLVIERYNNAAQSGAIQGMGSGWVIEDNEIRENAGAAIYFMSGARIVGNNIHHNHQIGLLGHGSNALVEGNEIAYNNYQDQYDYGWESGGTKFISTTNLVVRGNWVHDNHGPGLWTDADNVGTLYENNTVSNNYGPGIFHEISCQAVIRNNVVEGNAFPFYVGGILIANSRDVEVYGNTLTNNDGGIVGIEDSRGSGSCGARQVWNLWVHDNRVVHSAGYTGIRNNAGVADLYTGRNNRYDLNAYTSADPTPFLWHNVEQTFVQWQSAGNDLSGSIQ